MPRPFQDSIEHLQMELMRQFSPQLIEYLRIAFEMGEPKGFTTLRLVIAIFRYALDPNSPRLVKDLLTVAGTDVHTLENKAKVAAAQSPETNELHEFEDFISKAAKNVFIRSLDGAHPQWLDVVDILRAILQVRPPECEVLRLGDQPFWVTFNDWMVRAGTASTSNSNQATERFPSPEGPVPDTEDGLRRFIENINQRLNSLGSATGPYPEAVREELLERREEALKRLRGFETEVPDDDAEDEDNCDSIGPDLKSQPVEELESHLAYLEELDDDHDEEIEAIREEIDARKFVQALEDRFGCSFDTTGQSYLRAALAEARSETHPPILNSRHLLSALVQRGGLLEYLHIATPPPGEIKESYGRWGEPISKVDEEHENGPFPASVPLSFDVENLIRTAANLTQTTAGFKNVNQWHLAIALLSADYRGLKWQLNTTGIERRDLAKNLLEFMRESDPAFFGAGNWEALLDVTITVRPRPKSKDRSPSDGGGGAGAPPQPPNELPPSDPESSSPQPPEGPGKGYRPNREASAEEHCLDIDAYAEVIAEACRAAADEDDYVLALYGPWGRGKTTQMKKVSEILSPKSEEKLRDRSYHCQFFSAWKYPTRPEVWVHLYQCLAESAQSAGLWQKLRIGFRIGLLKNGWWPLLLGSCMFALSRVQLDIARWFFEGLGIIGLLILAAFIWNAMKLGKSLVQSYSGLPDHADKLGLQAVIGKDLKYLLKIWITGSPSPGRKKDPSLTACDFAFWWTWLRLALVVIFLCGSLFFVWLKTNSDASPGQPAAATLQTTNDASMPQVGVMRSEGGNPSEAEPLNIRVNVERADKKLTWQQPARAADAKQASDSGNWQLWLVNSLLVLLFLGCPSFAIAIAWNPRRFQKVLLIVDDLDRCEPDQMLAVIESIRLFLDDPEMSRRMQVAMLLDKELLEEALTKRYRDRRRGLDEDGAGEGTVRDEDKSKEAGTLKELQHLEWQREKFFVTELTLPKLSPEDVKKVAASVLDREFRAQQEKELAEAREAAAMPMPQPVQRTVESSTGKVPKRRQSADPAGTVVRRGNHIFKETTRPTTEEEVSEHEGLVQNAKQHVEQLERELGKTNPNAAAGEKQGPQDPNTEVNTTFEPWEREALKSAIDRHFEFVATPRSIRAFVLRYQLARLLLQRLKPNVEFKYLADALAEALRDDQSTERADISSELKWAVNHVI